MDQLPETYRKLVVTEVGRDFRRVSVVVEVPMPTVGPNEILIRNMFAGVNASDLNIAAGIYFNDVEPPYDMGVEATGQVVAVGESVQHFKVGDFALTTNLGGGYREYYATDANLAIPIPVATAEITAVSVAALSASMALEIAGQMGSGETVLITAAAGGVGHFAVQFAKLAGNHVIGVCGSRDKADYLKQLGCDRVIVYKEENLDAVLKAEYPNGIDLALEGVGQETFDIVVNNIARRGRIVCHGFVSEYKGNPIPVTMPRIYHQLLWKSATLRGFLFSDYVSEIPAHLVRNLQWFGEGKLHAHVDETVFEGIESVVDAVEHLHAGKNNGKIIVRF